ncbi:MAG: hypothetical protein ACIAS6_06265 [Phycisphaerales bacterium JB060]
MIRVTTAAVLALAGSALAQYEITIDVENPVLRPGESTVVTLLAGFDRSDYAMAAVLTDFRSSSGSTGLGDAALVEPMWGPGTDPGVRSATGYDGIIAGQIHFPPTSGIIGDPTNPIAFWQVEYTAPADVAAPFDIELTTMTSRYDVYYDYGQYETESRLAELTEGAATIRIVPAPASALVLALGAVAFRRRR